MSASAPESDVLLRAPEPGDAEALARLDRAGLPDFMTGDPALAPLVEMQIRARQANWAAAFPDARTRVLEVDGAAAGRLADTVGADGLHVIEIVVDPGFRRRGLAARMLRVVQDEAREKGCAATAHIYPDNTASLSLFAACGFALARAPDEVQVRAEWRPSS